MLHILDEISHNSGVSFVVGNLSRQNDKDVRFDYLVFKQLADKVIYNIEDNESEIFVLPKFSLWSAGKYRRAFAKLLQQKKYDIVHLHTPVTVLIHLRTAKKQGVPVRIIHSHNSRLADTFIKRVRNRLAISLGLRYASHFTACSKLAGQAVFGNRRIEETAVFINAVDTDRFAYNSEKRLGIRQQYGFGDEPILLHVGRMCAQKNQTFLLKVFARVAAVNERIRLVLLGNGLLKSRLKNQCRELGIEDKVLFAGVVDNPEDFMSAADILVMPSLYEGLPLVALEAQANGLRCIFSDKITREAQLSNECIFLPIDKTEKWAKKILSCVNEKRNRCGNKDVLEDISYEKQNIRLINYYKDILNRKLNNTK